MNQIATIHPTSMSVPATTPMTLLAGALERGMPLEAIKELMALQERYQATQARKDFDEAIAAAKAEIKPIIRNSKGHNNTYANMAAIADSIDPIIAKFGLSYRHRSRQDDRIHVTCILSHKAGHFEETTLTGPADKGPGRNDLQAIGSTLTYLQRYTVVLALGLSIAKDDDGKAAGVGESITDEQVSKLTKLLADKGRTTEQLCKVFNIDALSELPTRSYAAALEKIATAQPIKKDAA